MFSPWISLNHPFMKKSLTFNVLFTTLALSASALRAADGAATSTPTPVPAAPTTAPEKPAPVVTADSTIPATAIPDKAPVSDSAGTPGTGPAYKITLRPPTKVGQKFGANNDISMISDLETKAATPDAPPPIPAQIKEVTVHLEGDGEVLAVFPNGGMQKVALIVKTLTARQNGMDLPDLPVAGAKIVGEMTGNTTVITIDDKPASATVNKLLTHVLGLDDAKESDQDIFCPTDPVAVGATWSGNTALLADSLKETLGSTAQVKGAVKLEAVKGTGDDEVISISGNYSLDKFNPPLPPTITVDTATFKIIMADTIPESAKGTLKRTTRRTMNFSGHGMAAGSALSLIGILDQKGTTALTFY
jgi:hypothetical protein